MLFTLENRENEEIALEVILLVCRDPVRRGGAGPFEIPHLKDDS